MTGSVFVVDDDPAICALVEATLKAANISVRCYPSVEAFVPDANQMAGTDHGACCLLLDLVMPGQSGLDFLATRRPQDYGCQVIIMTARGTVDSAVKSMKLGATDFLEKPFQPEDLLALVRAALERSAASAPVQAQRKAVRTRIARLSRREMELLDAIVQGFSTKMVADRLGISARTVDHHRASLMEKMQAGNVADLVRMAVEADYKTI